MKMWNWSSRFATALALSVAVGANASGALLINEFQYDDGGTDDREYVELYNSGPNPVDISGYSVGTRDSGGVGASASAPVVIPGALGSGTTLIPAGGFYVIGNPGVANVNQTVATGMLENDTETIELRDGPFATGNLIDAVVYEGSAPFALPGDVVSEQGANPYYPNHQGIDLAGTPLKPATSVARYLDGADTNNNGRDFGLRPGTPGAPNATAIMTSYTPPIVDALADGAVVAGLTGSFVGARAITPGTVVAGLNPNAIPAPPSGGKAIVAWDGSGGGNGVVSNDAFSGAQEFKLYAYLDTANLPLSSNASNVTFRGSELTFYGLGGSIDAFTNLANVSGTVGITANSVNGATGVSWYYEKVGETGLGLGDVSEKLYLIDAGAGGNMNTDPGNAAADVWKVLATIDLSSSPSAWHHLSIAIDAAGNGVAGYDDQTFNFVTAPNLNGSFYVGYRENTQQGSVGVPSYLRPATFAVPEPSTIALAGVAVCCGLAVRRKSNV